MKFIDVFFMTLFSFLFFFMFGRITERGCVYTIPTDGFVGSRQCVYSPTPLHPSIPHPHPPSRIHPLPPSPQTCMHQLSWNTKMADINMYTYCADSTLKGGNSARLTSHVQQQRDAPGQVMQFNVLRCQGDGTGSHH